MCQCGPVGYGDEAPTMMWLQLVKFTLDNGDLRKVSIRILTRQYVWLSYTVHKLH